MSLHGGYIQYIQQKSKHAYALWGAWAVWMIKQMWEEGSSLEGFFVCTFHMKMRWRMREEKRELGSA